MVCSVCSGDQELKLWWQIEMRALKGKEGTLELRLKFGEG
jgi:hypothetical protein